MIWPAFVFAFALALVHLLGARLRFLDSIPRNAALSAGGGVSIAYVFLHLLPEIAEGQAHLEEIIGSVDTLEETLSWIAEGRHIWVLAMVGMIVIYALEHLAKRHTRDEQTEPEHPREGLVYWLHIGTYTLYNTIVGILLVREQKVGTVDAIVFTGAIGLHLLVNDYGLRHHFPRRYLASGRWMVSAAVILGAGLGALTDPGETITTLVMALLGGGVILNVLKEELPEDRRSRLGPFVLGAGIYAALLLAT